MQPGDLVRVEVRNLLYLYSHISGGKCLGACAGGEYLTVVADLRQVGDHIGRNGNIKVLHPQLGIGFTHAAFLEIVDETR
jgi:hypothetical protein